jgi:hypothetical protein
MGMNVRVARAPKVKEFVHSPFWTCPDCGAEGKFGVLMVCDRHYIRRCINCWFDQRLPLPALKKRIIYLDQFVISNMMKELDPASEHIPGFYRSLFERLDRLSKLQLIVCPDSPIQDHESVVDTRYEKIRAIFRQLSHGVSFHDPKTLLDVDIMHAFRSWISGKPLKGAVDRYFALRANPDVWYNEIRIDLNFTVPGLSQELRQAHELITNKLHQTCEEWRTERNFKFDDVFNNELDGSARLILERYARYAAHFAAVSAGRAPFDDEVCFAPREASLISRMLSDLAPSFPSWNERFERIRAFLASEHFRSIPGIRISALFWATIAREINSGRQPDRFPTAAMFNDIDAVAIYAPLCDAMFVDKEISHLAKQRELQQELAGSAALFSLRKNEKTDFIAFLDSIEKITPVEHFRMVEEVYGSDWPTPYVDILAIN